MAERETWLSSLPNGEAAVTVRAKSRWRASEQSACGRQSGSVGGSAIVRRQICGREVSAEGKEEHSAISLVKLDVNGVWYHWL